MAAEATPACEHRWKRVRVGVNLLCALALVGWIFMAAVGQSLGPRGGWPRVDYQIFYNFSRSTVQQIEYPDSKELTFLYPPPAAIGMYLISLPRPSLAACTWLALSLLSITGTLILGLWMAGLKQHPWRWLLVLAAFVLAEHYVIWDLRCQNCNLLYCFLVTAALGALHDRRDRACGLFLAAGVALKLYPALTIAYLAGIGRRRAFWAAVCGLMLLFGALPALFFGPENVFHIYGSWWRHLRDVFGSRTHGHFNIAISLQHTLAERLQMPAQLVPWLVNGGKLLWLSAVAAGLLAGGWKRRSPTGWDLLVDGGLLTLAPVVVSPYLESYHLVPVLLPLFALLKIATDARFSGRFRLGLLLWLAAGLTAVKISARLGSDPFMFRGLGVYAQMVSIAVALAAVRWQTARGSCQQQAPPLEEIQAPLCCITPPAKAA